MGKDLVDLTFFRESANEAWGFRLAGGKDYGQPLSISQVCYTLPCTPTNKTTSILKA